MPTIRVDKKPSGTYLSLIESYRDESGKSRMRTLANLGKAEDFQPETLKRIGERLYGLAGGDASDLTDNEIKEEGRYNFGYVQMVTHLLGYFGLRDVCRRITGKHRLGYDLESVVLLLLIERLCDPCSKRASYYHQEEYFGLPKLSLQWLYRSLDKLDQYSATIQEHIFSKGRHLFNQTLDLVFYDVTTLYFDSEIEAEGALRQKGFSKDGKIGKTQIMLGLLIDRHKQPVAYHIFEGNTFEGHTLKPVLQDLKTRYHLGKIIVVADRAMLSKANVEMVTEQLGLSYIFGERLKNMGKDTQELFLDKSKYKQEWVYNKDEQTIKIQYHCELVGGKRIISTYSEKRAKKDRHKRETKIAKAEQFLQNPTKLEAKARHHYLKRKASVGYELNQKKIKQDERFDGILAISTNLRELPETEILDQYRHLFQIEQSFRTMKSLLEIRPMFHWTDKRIRGHVCLCFISLAMLRNIELRLDKAGHHWSEKRILKTLDRMQLSLIEQNHNRYYLRSKPDPDQEILTKVFKLKKIKSLSSKALKIR